jgi:hypothetical protein
MLCFSVSLLIPEGGDVVYAIASSLHAIRPVTASPCGLPDLLYKLDTLVFLTGTTTT